MPIYYYFILTAADQSVQSIIGLIGISLGGGGAISIAINKIFDSNRIKVIVELQGEIKGLQREAKYRENDLARLEVENAELRNQIDTLQERSHSSINTQLIDMQEKFKALELNYRKAVTIIRKSKVDTNDTNH